MNAYPVSSHDTISQSILFPHVTDNPPKPLIVLSAVLSLHLNLEHLNLNIEIREALDVDAMSAYGRGQNSVGGTGHSASSGNLSNGKVGIGRDDTASGAVSGKKKRVDSGYTEKRRHLEVS